MAGSAQHLLDAVLVPGYYLAASFNTLFPLRIAEQTNDYLDPGAGPERSPSTPCNGGFETWLFSFALPTPFAEAFVHLCAGVGHLQAVQFMPLGGVLRRMGTAGKDA